MKNRKKIEKHVAEKRYYRRLRSKYKRRLRNGAHLSNSFLKKYHLNKTQNRYRTIGKYGHKKLQLLQIDIPERFSFTTDAEKTTSFLKKTNEQLAGDEPFNLFINHENTSEIGLGASFIFDQAIKSYILYWRQYRVHINLSGKVSKSKAVNNFLLSFGLLDELGMVHHSLFPDRADIDYKEKYITYKKVGSSTQKYAAGNASTELTQYFDSCLCENGFRIAEAAKSNLVDCFGEIIKNAEEHAGTKTTIWHVLGCYDKETHLCSFAIINYGMSFYESLANPESTAKEVLERVQRIVYSHIGFLRKLGIVRENYEELIWTMMALQDGISSKRSATGVSSTRGQGIMDVIEFIDAIRSAQKETNLAILSGKSLVQIDFTYPILNKTVGKHLEKRRIMTFNKESDLHLPPDDGFVKVLKGNFKGTVFSGKFVIDKEFLVSNTDLEANT